MDTMHVQQQLYAKVQDLVKEAYTTHTGVNISFLNKLYNIIANKAFVSKKSY